MEIVTQKTRTVTVGGARHVARRQELLSADSIISMGRRPVASGIVHGPAGVDVWRLTLDDKPLRIELRRGVTTIDDLDKMVRTEVERNDNRAR